MLKLPEFIGREIFTTVSTPKYTRKLRIVGR